MSCFASEMQAEKIYGLIFLFKCLGRTVSKLCQVGFLPQNLKAFGSPFEFSAFSAFSVFSVWFLYFIPLTSFDYFSFWGFGAFAIALLFCSMKQMSGSFGKWIHFSMFLLEKWTSNIKTHENLRPENFLTSCSRWQREADPRPTLEAQNMLPWDVLFCDCDLLHVFLIFFGGQFKDSSQIPLSSIFSHFWRENLGSCEISTARLRSWGFSLLNRCVRKSQFVNVKMSKGFQRSNIK